MDVRLRRSRPGAFGALVAAVLLIASACSTGATPSPSTGGGTSAAPGGSTAAGGSAAAGGSGAPAGTKHVAILNKDMTDDEIKAEIQKEGAVVVGNWTYSANSVLVDQFQKYVKATYGVDITLTYEGSQSPSEYITKLAAASKGGNPAPYDVMAIEENYWADATDQGLPDNYLPSDLIPNQKLVLDQFQHVPTSIAFQSTAFPGVVYNKTKAPFIKSLKDLANPALKGKLTLPAPGDITAGGFFLGLASELGKDYKDPNQMKEVVDWAMTNIGPNVTKYTSDQPTIQQLLESGAIDAFAFWNATARLEFLNGNKDAALLVPNTVYPANGYLWIPKNAPHPVLAQVFINWRLDPSVQFPNAWPINHGQWSELSEGFLGPDYVNLVPDWFKADYATFYPTLDQIKTNFKSIDWAAYNASAKVWQDYYASKIGQ
jgi:ABC-type Fe3+ transport system substrate-binding protein